ncbi:MAG: hypothetical protein CM1200mP16_10510 [Nitrospina sp.]|nr:MAG: hypothetical protein CM1200mP16_10510 [Nitrospina sp.]
MPSDYFYVIHPKSLSLGLMAGLVNLVPYLGLVLGFVPAAILTFLHTQEWLAVLGVAGVFAFVQGIEGMIITPRIVGEKLVCTLLPSYLLFFLGVSFGPGRHAFRCSYVAILNVLFSRSIFQYKNSPFYSDS